MQHYPSTANGMFPQQMMPIPSRQKGLQLWIWWLGRYIRGQRHAEVDPFMLLLTTQSSLGTSSTVGDFINSYLKVTWHWKQKLGLYSSDKKNTVCPHLIGCASVKEGLSFFLTSEPMKQSQTLIFKVIQYHGLELACNYRKVWLFIYGLKMKR